MSTKFASDKFLRPEGVRNTRAALSAACVWLIWAALTCAALGLAIAYGPRFPTSDDWNFVPYVIGHSPVSLNWLWEQHNEHRILVPKLVAVIIYRIGGLDYRYMVILNIILLSLISIYALMLCRLIRGHNSLSDILIPALFLSYGQNAMSWGFEFQFTSVSAITCAFSMMILGSPIKASPWRVTASGLLLILLPLCGGTGLILAPGLGMTLLAVAWRGGSPPARLAAVATVTMAALICGASMIGYHPIPRAGGDPTAQQLAWAVLQLPTLAWGYMVQQYPSKSVLVTAALIALSAINLIMIARDSRADIIQRRRAWVLLACQASFAPLAVAVAFGRFEQLWGSVTHYSTLAMPLLFWSFLGLLLRGETTVEPQVTVLRKLVQFGCGVAMLIFSATYLVHGLRQGPPHLDMSRKLHAALEAGLPTQTIIDRYGNELFFTDSAETRRLITSGIQVLREKQVPGYGK